MNRYNIILCTPDNIGIFERDIIWYNPTIRGYLFIDRSIRINGLYYKFGIRLIKNEK